MQLFGNMVVVDTPMTCLVVRPCGPSWASSPCPCGSIRETSTADVRAKSPMQTPRPARLAPRLLDKASPWPWSHPGSRYSWCSQLLATSWHVPTQSYFISVVLGSSWSTGLRGRAAEKTIFNCTRALMLTTPNSYDMNEWAFQVMGFKPSQSGGKTQPTRLGRMLPKPLTWAHARKTELQIVVVIAAKGVVFINVKL